MSKYIAPTLLGIIGLSLWVFLFVASAFFPSEFDQRLDSVSAKSVFLVWAGAFLILAGAIVFNIVHLRSVKRVAANGCWFWSVVSVYLIGTASLSGEGESSFRFELDAEAGVSVWTYIDRLFGVFGYTVIVAAATSLVGLILLILLYAFVSHLDKRGHI